jgi:GAF domain-containing protein
VPDTGQEAKRFEAAYLDSFRAYVREPSETTLRAAYELGRAAVQGELSVLDVAIAHHAALAAELRTRHDEDEEQRVVGAAGEFLLESISAFEMVQRGFREARDAALLERRHAELLRRLSHFLADASLAFDASGSLEEMLRIVAEQARELIPAECSLVTTGGENEVGTRVSSHVDDDLRWATFARWVDLSHIDALIRSAGHPARLGAEVVATHIRMPGSGATADLTLRGWLATPLTALDGRSIGSIHVVTESEAGFTGLHEAVLHHLAQMSAAAIERSRLYSRAGR